MPNGRRLLPPLHFEKNDTVISQIQECGLGRVQIMLDLPGRSNLVFVPISLYIMGKL